jgi:hypothetical protein
MPFTNGKITALELPRKHSRVLFDQSKPWRFRALWGGRNGAKDWSIAAACVETGLRVSKRFLFTREVQKTLAASAHQLIVDTINRLGYRDLFTVTENKITCNRNDTMFLFNGLNDLVAKDLKSWEGVDIAVICEAEDLTKKSFDILNFTLRKPGSEIWVQFNPQFDDDFVYEFCVLNPPDNLIGCEVNGFGIAEGKTVVAADNPWIASEQIKEAQRMHDTDLAAFNNQCLGKPMGQGGRIYPQFCNDIHVIDFDRRMIPQCDLYMSIDPHRKYYPAITWNAITPCDCVVGYNEWPKYEDLGMWYDQARETKTLDFGLKELAAYILANDLTLGGGRIVSRTIDPRFHAENPDFVRALMEYGVLGWVDAPCERIETQRENIKSLMYYSPLIPVYGSNMPSFYLDRRCTNRIRAYTRHCYAEGDNKDKEGETHKDFPDADRYWLSQFTDGKPRFIERNCPAMCGELNSLSSVMLSALPAVGYNDVHPERRTA